MKDKFNFGNFKVPDFEIKPIKIKPLNIKPVKIKTLGGKTFREEGKDFEVRVKRDLKKRGYKISKSHSRHYDWHAHKSGREYAIECKCTKAGFTQQEVKFSHQAKKKGLIYKVARRTPTGRIEYENIK